MAKICGACKGKTWCYNCGGRGKEATDAADISTVRSPPTSILTPPSANHSNCGRTGCSVRVAASAMTSATDEKDPTSVRLENVGGSIGRDPARFSATAS